jgi:hypothetical protein
MQSRFFIICQTAAASLGLALLVARLSVGSFPVDNLVGVVIDALLFVGSGAAALVGLLRRRRARRPASPAEFRPKGGSGFSSAV